jgi:hypothetical protein
MMRKTVARTPILIIMGVFLVSITSCLNVFAQGNDADLENRVFNLGILRTGRSKSKSAKKNVDPKVLFAQVQEDFTAIQVTNNELAEVLEKKNPLDLEVVAKSVTEIRTRAVRLMENLTESKATNREGSQLPNAATSAELKERLLALDKLVVEFTHNRVFKEESPDDEKLAKKALLDLDQIIKMSSNILASVEHLKKSA